MNTKRDPKESSDTVRAPIGDAAKLREAEADGVRGTSLPTGKGEADAARAAAEEEEIAKLKAALDAQASGVLGSPDLASANVGLLNAGRAEVDRGVLSEMPGAEAVAAYRRLMLVGAPVRYQNSETEAITGLVCKANDDGSFNLRLFPDGQGVPHKQGVFEGTDVGEFTFYR